MGWWNDWGRRATTGVLTGGLSEAWNPDNYSQALGGGSIFDPGDKISTSDVPDANRGNFQLPFGDDMRRRDQRLGDMYGQRTAPQAQDSPYWQQQQQGLAQRLQSQLNGTDSLSQLQLRQATDQNLAQQRSLAASASPQNAAMAQRLAMQNAGNINAGYGQQAAMLGIQERNAAANALGQLSGLARGQDQNMSQFNANAQLQSRGLNDAAQNNAYGRGLQTAGMQMAGNMGYESNQTARRGQDLGVPNGPSTYDRIMGFAQAAAPFVAKAAMKDGGVVTRPTMALIGEAGPEVVVPLDRLHEVASRMKTTPLERAPAPPPPPPPRSPVPQKHRGMLPGELSKDASASTLPKLADGGVVTQPTRAIVGEAGPEAVIPLSKIGEVIRQLMTQPGPQARPEELSRSRPAADDRSELVSRDRGYALPPPAPIQFLPPFDTSVMARPEELSRARGVSYYAQGR